MKLKGKIWNTGNSYVLTVPKSFIDAGILEKDKEYIVEILEVDD